MYSKETAADEGRYLLHLLACVINGSKPSELPDGMSFEKVYELAQKHNVGAMSFAAVEKLSVKPSEELLGQWREQRDKEFCRDVIQRSEYSAICRAFAERGVRMLPLKGILIKSLYPKSYMRMMSDIDLLIDAENADTVHGIMLSLGYTAESFGAGSEDVYHKEPLMSVEVHRSLFSESEMEGLSGRHFGDPWQHSRHTGGGVYEMSANFFFGYVLAHAAKHYLEAGTGIKHFMDMRLISCGYGSLIDTGVLGKLMRSENVSLCRDMLRLSEQWFGEAEPDGSLGSMEEFVLSSGVYGSRQNALDRKLAEKGRLGYLLYELFIPADRIVYDYPVLEDKPYLLPVIRLRRLFDKTAGDPQLLKMNIKSLLRHR